MGKLKGYMTVEISLLFPIIMTVICFIIYMVFICHDACITKAWLYKTALRSTVGEVLNADDSFEDDIYDVVAKRLIISDIYDISCERDSNGIELKTRTKYEKAEKLIVVKVTGLSRRENILKYRFIKEVTE